MSSSPVSTISFPCSEAYPDDCSHLSMSSFRKAKGRKQPTHYPREKVRPRKNEQKQSDDAKVEAEAMLEKLDALSIKLSYAIVSNEKLKAEHSALAEELSLPTQCHSTSNRRRQPSREARHQSNTGGMRRKSLQAYIKESRRRSSIEEETFCSGATSKTSLESSDRTDETSPIDYTRSTRRSSLKSFLSSSITDEYNYTPDVSSHMRQERRLSLFD